MTDSSFARFGIDFGVVGVWRKSDATQPYFQAMIDAFVASVGEDTLREADGVFDTRTPPLFAGRTPGVIDYAARACARVALSTGFLCAAICNACRRSSTSRSLQSAAERSRSRSSPESIIRKRVGAATTV